MATEIITMTKDDLVLAFEEFRRQIVDELKKNLCIPMKEERKLIDREGVANILGVSKPTVDRYRSKIKDFPKPIEVMEGKPMWDSEDIYKFIERKKQERRKKDEKKQEFSFS